ncbi:MAG: glucose-1-phosphate thymidylyltransferase, partial [Elusimicrobia bacterium]|nr:glucose-1-phosphate thymidylyltransferase [Elusimicrobiota bacterium]MDY5729452.1 glucose-1-phosphate thymidylyltransferase [Elusimicrobiaceae bacterium]
ERGFAWLDTGTHESVLQAANFVHSMQLNQGIEIACLEEIALQKGFITRAELQQTLSKCPSNAYYRYAGRLLAKN